MFLASVISDWLALWRQSATLAMIARGNLIGAALTVPLALAAGLAARQWQFEGARLKGSLRLHLLSALIWLLCWLRSHRAGHDARLTLSGDRGYLGLSIVAAALVALTGHPGGFVSGINGVPP